MPTPAAPPSFCPPPLAPLNARQNYGGDAAGCAATQLAVCSKGFGGAALNKQMQSGYRFALLATMSLSFYLWIAAPTGGVSLLNQVIPPSGILLFIGFFHLIDT